MTLTDEMKDHVLSCFPEEACGVVTNEGFIPLVNEARDPINSFKIGYGVLNEIAKEQDILYIFHSHCRDPNRDYGMIAKYDIRTPSSADALSQRACGIPYLITGTDGEIVEELLEFPASFDTPLLGRRFMWFVNDCWTLVRDYYWQTYKIDLGWHANDFDWYNNGRGVDRPYYKEHFQSRGFEQIDEVQLKEGDVIVMGINGDYNHIGVFQKDFRVLQQLVERPSALYPFSAMKSYVQMYLRYKG